MKFGKLMIAGRLAVPSAARVFCRLNVTEYLHVVCSEMQSASPCGFHVHWSPMIHGFSAEFFNFCESGRHSVALNDTRGAVGGKTQPCAVV